MDEFADVPSPRTRHPLLLLGAGVLALFLVAKMRNDLSFFFGSREIVELGDARALLANPNGPRVLGEAVNRLVRVSGTPDREAAVQVDTKGSWTFTQLFRLFGTQSRLLVHRREDPLPAFRAESDVFEGRLIRVSDLPFEDAIRAYFASHVGATHFFRLEDVRRAVAAGAAAPVSLTDLAGDAVALGPSDILAFELKHAGQFELGLPAARFPNPEAARDAIEKRGARVLGRGRAVPERQTFVFEVASGGERDRVLNDVTALDYQSDLRDVRETVKVRLADLVIAGDGLTVKAGAAAPAAEGAGEGAAANGAAAATPRPLAGVETVRTLANVQIPADAYLIIEAETQREHLSDAAIAAVLVAFASVNLGGLLRGLRASGARRKP